MVTNTCDASAVEGKGYLLVQLPAAAHRFGSGKGAMLLHQHPRRGVPQGQPPAASNHHCLPQLLLAQHRHDEMVQICYLHTVAAGLRKRIAFA